MTVTPERLVRIVEQLLAERGQPDEWAVPMYRVVQAILAEDSRTTDDDPWAEYKPVAEAVLRAVGATQELSYFPQS